MQKAARSHRERIRIPRRSFVKGVAAAGAAAGLGLSPRSFAGALGSNDRFVIGHIGVGGRGTSLLKMTIAMLSRVNRPPWDAG